MVIIWTNDLTFQAMMRHIGDTLPRIPYLIAQCTCRTSLRTPITIGTCCIVRQLFQTNILFNRHIQHYFPWMNHTTQFRMNELMISTNKP